MSNKLARELIQGLGILIVDHNQHQRRLTRMMLTTSRRQVGLRGADGLAALEIVRTNNPDIMVLERDVPVLSGPELLQIVRSPDLFPRPDLPVIMVMQSAQRHEVIEALRLGAHELLVKPTSPKALQDRLLSVMLNPRKMVRIGKYYVPQPRRVRSMKRVVAH